MGFKSVGVFVLPGLSVGARRSSRLDDGGAWSVGAWVRAQHFVFPNESSVIADITVGIDYFFGPGRPRHGPRLAVGVIRTVSSERTGRFARYLLVGPPSPLCDVSYAVEVIPERFLVVVGSWIAEDLNRSSLLFGPYRRPPR